MLGNKKIRSVRRRGQRGSALVELALVLPFVALIVLGTIDVGRAYRMNIRLTNVAREGASVAQFNPLAVDSGCSGAANVTDRAAGEDTTVTQLPSYRVRIYKKDASGNLVPSTGITGCNSTSPGVTVAAGDRFVVEASAAFDPITPFITRVAGSRITITGSQEVVMQG